MAGMKERAALALETETKIKPLLEVGDPIVMRQGRVRGRALQRLGRRRSLCPW
jgi:hypothetical protein